MDCFTRLAEFSKRSASFIINWYIMHRIAWTLISAIFPVNFSISDVWTLMAEIPCCAAPGSPQDQLHFWLFLLLPKPISCPHSWHCSSVSWNACSEKSPDVVWSCSLPLTCPGALLADAGWLYVLAQRHWDHPNLPGFFRQLFLNSSRSLWLTHWSPINWIIGHFPLLYLASAFIK